MERRQKLVSNLRQRFLRENILDEDLNHPNQKNTEHITREETAGDVSDGEKRGLTEKQPVNSVSDIFKDRNGKKVRTVLTIGESNIGKSFHMKKFIKHWAENIDSNRGSVLSWMIDSAKSLFGKTKNEEVIFPLNPSELNMIQTKLSLVGLLKHLIQETKTYVISDFARFNLVFTLDGLDAYRHPLDFDNNQTVTDVREAASVDVLLTNLIKGNLLPSACLWITSRPRGAEWLPADRTTEIRGKVNTGFGYSHVYGSSI